MKVLGILTVQNSSRTMIILLDAHIPHASVFPILYLKPHFLVQLHNCEWKQVDQRTKWAVHAKSTRWHVQPKLFLCVFISLLTPNATTQRRTGLGYLSLQLISTKATAPFVHPSSYLWTLRLFLFLSCTTNTAMHKLTCHLGFSAFLKEGRCSLIFVLLRKNKN